MKQSWSSSVFSTIKAVIQSIPIIFDLRPDLLLLNGPGTCIPLVIAAVILQLATSHDVKIGQFLKFFENFDKNFSFYRIILPSGATVNDGADFVPHRG